MSKKGIDTSDMEEAMSYKDASFDPEKCRAQNKHGDQCGHRPTLGEKYCRIHRMTWKRRARAGGMPLEDSEAKPGVRRKIVSYIYCCPHCDGEIIPTRDEVSE